METLGGNIVSLDELMLDLSDDRTAKYTEETDEDESQERCATLSPENEIHNQTEGPLNLCGDISILDHVPQNSNHFEAQTSIVENDTHITPQTEENDFDDDVPPLLLFTNAKQTHSDDSDSEFEVPERESALKENDISAANTSTASPKSNYDAPLTQKQTSFDPEILTPREKIKNPLSSLFGAETLVGSEPSPLGKRPVDVYLTPGQEIGNLEDSVVQDSTVQDSSVQSDAEFNIPSKFQAEPVKAPVEFVKHDNEHEAQKPDIITTAEDWEGVLTVEPGFTKPGQKSAETASGFESKPLGTFTESWKVFESEDYSAVRGDIKPRIEKRGFSAFTHMLFGPPKILNELIPQRDLVFCIAATPLNNDNKEHCNVLQTIYRCLTGSKFECQRFGNHWEEIGFQGRDPATDLRGTGMLALLHLLYFLRDPSTKDLARDIYKLSLHPTQNFPFCVMGINLSRVCVQVLREEIYNKECNKRKDVIGTINNVYAALYLKLYSIWKQGKTIADSGFVLKEVEAHGRKHSKTIFKDLETYELMKKQKGPFGEHVEAEPAFFNVCKEDKCDTKSAAELY